MATYKEIKGTQIEAVASDPSNPVEGQVWYNTTSNDLKSLALTVAGAWATTGSLNQARNQLASAGQAARDSSLVFNGFNNPTKYAQTELFNGSAWTELNDLNAGRAAAWGFGTNTAAITAGGYDGPPGAIAICESWNGTNWTEVNNMNSPGYSGGSAGTSTAGFAFGGITTPPFGILADTESWNGTNWTNTSGMNTDRYSTSGTGASNTQALCFGGSPGQKAVTESWNGSNWTEVNDLNTARAGVAGAGLYTAALCIGGDTGSLTGKTETWNGTNWAEDGDLNTARSFLVGSGNSNASAIAAGGQAPGNSSAAETWVGAGAGVTRTFTDS